MTTRVFYQKISAKEHFQSRQERIDVPSNGIDSTLDIEKNILVPCLLNTYDSNFLLMLKAFQHWDHLCWWQQKYISASCPILVWSYSFFFLPEQQQCLVGVSLIGTTQCPPKLINQGSGWLLPWLPALNAEINSHILDCSAVEQCVKRSSACISLCRS